MKRIIIILAFLVCGISSAQQYFFNGTIYVPKTTVQINAIVSPPEGRVEANSDTGSLWYFDGTIWKDTFVGVSSFEDLEGDPYDNAMLSDALNSKANDSAVVKINPNSLVSPLTLAVSDSTTIASGIFTINDVVIDTTTRTPGGDKFVTDGNLSGAGVLTLNRNYGSPIQIPGFNLGDGAESGVFTADLSDSLGGATYTPETTTHNFYRIGDLVYINIYFQNISIIGSPSGNLIINNISGLPGQFDESFPPIFNVNIALINDGNIASISAKGVTSDPNTINFQKSGINFINNTTPLPSPLEIDFIHVNGFYKM